MNDHPRMVHRSTCFEPRSFCDCFQKVVLTIQGLRSQESVKFNRFFNIIQDTASKENCVFFADSGEGHDFSTDDIECEDMSGWLIPNDKVDEFEKEFTEKESWKIDDKWIEFFLFAIWEIDDNGKVIIQFKEF